MDFGEILSKAWKITWKHKILWIFGILAGCSNNGNRFNFQGSNRSPSSSGELPGGFPIPEVERFFEQIPEETWIMVAVIAVVVILVLVALTVFLSTIGRIGLIRGTLQADQPQATTLTFGGVFRDSTPYFWRIFGLDLAVGLVLTVVIIALIVVPLVMAFTSMNISPTDAARDENLAMMGGYIIAFMICLCCILMPLGWLVNLLLQVVHNAIIVEDMGIVAGLHRGWEVLRANFVNFFLIWLIVGLGIGFIGGMIIAMPMIAVAMPFVMTAFAGARNAMMTGLAISLVCLVAYLPVLLVLQGILQTYMQSVWTLAYLRLTGRPAVEIMPAPEILAGPAL